jgi:hypothetical protein
MATEQRGRCGNCVMFHTPKCIFAFSAVEINPRPPRVVHGWRVFIENLYDFAYLNQPMGPRKIVSNYDLIFATDAVCAEFEEL